MIDEVKLNHERDERTVRLRPMLGYLSCVICYFLLKLSFLHQVTV